MRDCTVQRAHRKVVEETAVLTPDVEQRVRSAAERICRAAQFSNVGTVEFLAQAGEPFAFVEANPRLQVEHALTELTSGIDLVKLQLDLARGGRLDGVPPPTSGHALEVRLSAEDPEHDFAPSNGRILLFRMPTGPGVRVDAGVAQHDDLPPGSDALLATICAWGRDRNEALARRGTRGRAERGRGPGWRDEQGLLARHPAQSGVPERRIRHRVDGPPSPRAESRSTGGVDLARSGCNRGVRARPPR